MVQCTSAVLLFVSSLAHEVCYRTKICGSVFVASGGVEGLLTNIYANPRAASYPL